MKSKAEAAFDKMQKRLERYSSLKSAEEEAKRTLSANAEKNWTSPLMPFRHRRFWARVDSNDSAAGL